MPTLGLQRSRPLAAAWSSNFWTGTEKNRFNDKALWRNAATYLDSKFLLHRSQTIFFARFWVDRRTLLLQFELQLWLSYARLSLTSMSWDSAGQRSLKTLRRCVTQKGRTAPLNLIPRLRKRRESLSFSPVHSLQRYSWWLQWRMARIWSQTSVGP